LKPKTHKSYTFYIAVNPSLSKMYGDRGLPAKVGYTKERDCGSRLKGLNGKRDKDTTKYGEVKGSEHVLEEDWRIPEGCFLYLTNVGDPTVIENRIHEEILAKGGQKIEGHSTIKKGDSVRSVELFILPECTQHIQVKNDKPSWKTGITFFGGGPAGAGGGIEFVEVEISAEETLQSLMAKLQQELEPGGADFS
jgi:hypothetical protein